MAANILRRGRAQHPVMRISPFRGLSQSSGIFASSTVENLGISSCVLASGRTPRYPDSAIAEHVLGDTHMNVKSLIVVTAVVAAVAFAACRREVRHEPLKLGAGDLAATQAQR